MISTELNISNLEFAYKAENGHEKNLVINKFDYKFNSNKVYVILGLSGCGKTTLLNLIAGVLNPDKGEIVYKENDKVVKPKIGYVFQTPSLIPWQTVKKNVMLGAEIAGRITSEAEKQADRLISAYGLKEFADSYPFSLSGGMQQRVSIIRAVVSGANILLLDEPFSNSDFILRKELQEDLLRIVSEQNLIVILITHDLVEAAKLGDNLIVLSKRPATVQENFKIDIDRNQRMAANFLPKEKLIKVIENVNAALIGQSFVHQMEGDE